MKLSDLNKVFFFLIIFSKLSISYAENEIDIWKKKNLNENNKGIQSIDNKIESPLLLNKNKITTNNILQ